jgi:electron transfer flavoprotein alpha subunit
MSEILVLVDHADGAVRKTTNELLTIARRLGEPSAVFIGSDVSTAAESLKQYGAEKVYAVDDSEIKDFLVAPKAEALAQLVAKANPAAVLISSSRRSPAASPSRPIPA